MRYNNPNSQTLEAFESTIPSPLSTKIRAAEAAPQLEPSFLPLIFIIILAICRTKFRGLRKSNHDGCYAQI